MEDGRHALPAQGQHQVLQTQPTLLWGSKRSRLAHSELVSVHQASAKTPQPRQEPLLFNCVPSLTVYTFFCPPALFLNTQTPTVGCWIRSYNPPYSDISNAISHPSLLSLMTTAVGSLIMAKMAKPGCSRALQGISWCVTMPGTLGLPGMATTACRPWFSADPEMSYMMCDISGG